MWLLIIKLDEVTKIYFYILNIIFLVYIKNRKENAILKHLLLIMKYHYIMHLIKYLIKI